MAPGGKRKRGDRSESNDANSRPSPHRPQNLGLGNQQYQNNARGGRRGSRTGGRGGNNSTPQSPSVTHQSPTAMSPPATIPSANRPSSQTPTQTQAPAPSTPIKTTPNPPPQTQKPASPRSPNVSIYNEYLKQDLVTSWSSGGRSKLVKETSEQLGKGDWLQLSIAFEEIIQACVDRTIASDELGSVISEVLATPSPEEGIDPISIFLDTISTLTETGATTAPLKGLLEATGIDPARMRSELETSLLTTLNLVRPTFSRVAIRKATHALYRQSNYNLLREETEGYSKLVTEYFTTVNNEPPSAEVVTETFQRVKALIGAFDLDVGRVLDVTLDVFANLLVKHTKFFVKLLRVSSWWPELKDPHGIEWTEPLVSALPLWASPDFALHYYTEEQKDEQLRLRQERDVEFWKSVDELGIKAWFDLGARKITSSIASLENLDDTDMKDDTDRPEKKATEAADFENIQKWTQEWMAETKTLTPNGNRIAAQLLGFKLRFYASDVRDAHDILPENLIYLAALLIKIGFISLVDLYPHIYPLDADMPAHRDKLMKAKKERDDKASGRSNNALAMAGALPDEGVPQPASVVRLRESESKASSKPDSERGTPTSDDEPKPQLPEPADQKVALLRSLLCIGAIPEALFILSRFPWLLEVYPDLHAYLFRLAHHSLSKVYEESKDFSPEDTSLSSKHAPENAAARPSDYVPRRTLRWAKMEEKDAGDGIDYRFYWEDWMDNVPVCQNVDDVLKLCNSLLGLIGVECGKDAVLLTKLARIARKNLAGDSSKQNTKRWITFSATFLGPALSYSGENPGVVNEVWALFSQFDTATRYSIYQNWFAGPGKSKLRPKFAEVTHTVQQLFRRISSENTREMGRALATSACSSPGIVFELALRAAESYSNMIQPLVECCRYLTPLGYDCLNWTFINAFKNTRATMEGDGMLTKSWLRHTATFMGKAYKQYAKMDATPLLQFIADQMLRGKFFGLQILDQLVSSMGGIAPNPSLSESQVHGLSAGPLLRAFTLEHYLGDKRHDSIIGSKRLLSFLNNAGLSPQILITMALELEQYVYHEEFEDTPLKVLGINLDNLRLNFDQYLDFLRTNLSVEEFNATIPGLVELMALYGVAPPIAFAITRESLARSSNAARAEIKSKIAKSQQALTASKTEDSSKSETPQTNGDVPMAGVDEAPSTSGTQAESTTKSEPMETEDGTEVKEDVEMKESSNEEKPTPAPLPGRTNPAIDAIATQLKERMPDTYGSHICLNFFVTFWQLSLADVFTTTSMKELKEYTTAWKFYSDKAMRVRNDRRDMSSAGSNKRNANSQAFHELSASLRAEPKDVLESALKIREHLKEEMHQWFDGIPMVDARSEELHDTILQDCFLARVMLSPQDAQYASAMLKFMHELGVPGFRTMKLLDQLFRQKLLTNVFFMCTGREAQNLGRFLNDILKELNFWHAKQANYTKFAQGQKKSLPGFGRTFNADRTPSSFLDFEDYRRVLYKWHTQLFRALETCLKSDEYMHIRNAVNILKAIAPNFPKVETMGKGLQQTIQHLSQNDSREDLKLTAMSLLGDFKKNEKFWMSQAIFHHTRNAPNASNASTASRTGSEQPKTPQAPEPTNSKLDAAAPEFEPEKPTTNGASGANGGEAESSDADKKQIPVPEETQEPGEASQSERNDNTQDAEPQPSSIPPIPPVSRSDSRGAHTIHPSRATHALPARPDAHLPARGPRQTDRGGERPPPEFSGHNRSDPRSNATPEYVRHDRQRDPMQRESFAERREASPGRGPRGRTPERGSGWGSRERDPRDQRELRDYPDERAMRPPPRDIRGPPQYDNRDSREPRHPRDPRDRVPLPPTPMDGRGRMHPTPSTPDNSGSYRHSHQNSDRGAPLPPRPSGDRPSNTQTLTPSGPAERGMINPERAALMGDERPRNEGYRSDREREPRRERDPRHPSPRRDERVPPSYPPRHEGTREIRDPRDSRGNESAVHGRTPPHPGPPPGRDRRDEQAGAAPTGPRGPRGDAPSRTARDAFLAPHGHRAAAHPAQDPNYGRLNAPAEAIPSGPRNPQSDRRDTPRREPEQPRPAPAQQAATPTTPQGTAPGIHPSRLSNFNAGRPSPIQTDSPSVPSGPRGGSTRTQQGPSPSTSRAVPTGPASSTERNGRNRDGNQLRAITSVLSQNVSTPEERSPVSSAPQVRGRGSRNMPPAAAPPAGPPQHSGTPNAPRTDYQQPRGDKSDHSSNRNDGRFDDGRQEQRGHRDGRRRGRSRSQERGDRPPREERAPRNGPEERTPRGDEQERPNERERGSGRDRRAGDGGSSRRDKERDGRERRERKDDGRPSGRNEEMGMRRGGPPVGPDPMLHQNEGRGDPSRGGRGGERREDRGDRRRDDQRDERRDNRGGRKRERGEEALNGDPKRQRR
ncbi:hypothetical protein BU24DRAFT_253260 [Aaosphaeria arxii CBS 175.79]|uniref:THO complex subunit 2 n=1 Tax=Aaosphaeria arxii CBS 175.79 TaxID=1450172 RepID=A0A6A5XI05_9PLEO|nr:uncharacterized protein BU24DRAFT_253260 [Aaosphaeria arxii CBS 175.79]KAF2012509.1 hypothetical protein BU24DRAFT_253260 [Aaosphaeria arxii CBS 175.79]